MFLSVNGLDTLQYTRYKGFFKVVVYFYFSFFLIRTVVCIVQYPFNIVLNKPRQYKKLCVSVSPELLYLLFHYTSPGTKSLSELKVTYSVFVGIMDVITHCHIE